MIRDGDRQDRYIPPKKPYSFEAMLGDILEFGALHLVDNARLSLWMPTANDEAVELGVPTHPCLEIVSVCVQPFNKCGLTLWSQIVQTTYLCSHNQFLGSRRLLTYRRIPNPEINALCQPRSRTVVEGYKADDLNAFRKRVASPQKVLRELYNGTNPPHSISRASEPRGRLQGIPGEFELAA